MGNFGWQLVVQIIEISFFFANRTLKDDLANYLSFHIL